MDFNMAYPQQQTSPYVQQQTSPYVPQQAQMYAQSFPQQTGFPYAAETYPYLDMHQPRSQLFDVGLRRSISLGGLRQGAMAEKGESKARLAKDQVDILEAKFQENNKPNSQVKRDFAVQFGVEPARINNWFQNRRAKAKQEKKQAENEAARGDGSVDEGSKSPESSYQPDVFGDESVKGGVVGNSVEMPILSGPTPTTMASIARLEKASATAFNPVRSLGSTSGLSISEAFEDDAQSEDPRYYMDHESHFGQQQALYAQTIADRATPFGSTQSSSSFSSAPQFPSQLINGAFDPAAFDSHAVMPIGEPGFATGSPVARRPSFSLSQVPGPTNIAVRRAKAKPAALGLEAIKAHTAMGPRSMSSPVASIHPVLTNSPPLAATSSPMRRVQSNVMSGRIQKSSTPVLREQRSLASLVTNCETYLTRDGPFAGAVHPGIFGSPLGLHTTAMDASQLHTPETPGRYATAAPWAFELQDRTMQTPTFDLYGPELSLNMPYVSPTSASQSQPQTPAFARYNGLQHQSPAVDFGDFSGGPSSTGASDFAEFTAGSHFQEAMGWGDKLSPFGKSFPFSSLSGDVMAGRRLSSGEELKTPVPTGA